MNDLKKHNIVMMGKTFPIKVSQSEAEWIPHIENTLNKKLSIIQEQYKHISKEESLMMTLISYAFDNKKLESDLQVLSKGLKQMEKLFNNQSERK